VGDLRGQAWSLQCLGNVTLLLGDLDAAQAIHTDTLAVARQAQSAACIGGALTGLGSLAARRGDHARAYELYLKALELRRSDRDRVLTDQLNVLGRAALDIGDSNLAAAHFRESLEMCRQQGIKWDAALALAGLAEVSMAAGNLRHSARLFAAVDALLSALRAKRSADDQAEHDRMLQALKDLLGEAAFEQAWASGREMTREEAIACALDEQ